MKTQEIPMYYYIDLLEQRRKQIAENYGWTIPDCVWDYAVEAIEGCGVSCEDAEPSSVVDDLALTCYYATFEECADYGEYEDEDDFIRAMEKKAMAVFEDERIVLFSL